jgi:uncharacterized caspase-like protein
MNRFVKLLLLCILAAPAQAANHWALLVGVSEYPSLAPERQLRGPRNDVIALRDTLLGMEVDRRRIIVLADGVPQSDGMPTRVAITSSLDRLSRDVRAEDFVFIYFSGHGSQQPAAAEDREEPDGLDEIFLPRDIGRWDGKAGSVKNALTDNEINRLTRPLLAAGAQVWAVFDTCHSGTMTRGSTGALLDDVEVKRSVRPAELGVPLFQPSVRSVADAAHGLRNWPEKLVVFSAAQSNQSTPELRLPAGDPARVEHGLFTYTLLRALRANGPANYEQLAQSIATRYAIMQRAAPTPVFEGRLHSAVPLAAALVRPIDLDAAPVRVSEPVLCDRQNKRVPCGAPPAPGDADLRAQAALWLRGVATGNANILRVRTAIEADIALIVQGGRVWLVATSDDYHVGDRHPPSVADAAAFATSLRAIVNVQRLFTVAERPSAPLDLTVSIHRSAPSAGTSCKTPQSSQLDFTGAPPSLRAGELLCMLIANKGSMPLDVTLLHVGADYSVQPLFPLRNESNRIAANTERRIALEVVADEAPSLDRLVALAVSAQGDEPVDFSWMSQSGIDRAVRGTQVVSRPLWMQTMRWIAQPEP